MEGTGFFASSEPAVALCRSRDTHWQNELAPYQAQAPTMYFLAVHTVIATTLPCTLFLDLDNQLPATSYQPPAIRLSSLCTKTSMTRTTIAGGETIKATRKRGLWQTKKSKGRDRCSGIPLASHRTPRQP
ncbi:hypothetical protein KQX54_021241 [Cotesia glomerata]|uniref:Uncharacterized protein n=1 Tax=Cotesia glomerata TaxID=32391 RepID=A0AAV7J929_COTGL|nr:hypothetical protein KQX54_021241 [Cotesia glomerata]